ncbi:Ribokinase-like protein, partial [Syncephalis fuscata]
MSRVLSFGSINIDEFYFVSKIAVPGQTVKSTHRARLAGGKVVAGANAYAAGKIGSDGVWLRDGMERFGVNVTSILVDNNMSTGRAIIQSSVEDGENAIILFAGTNGTVDATEVAGVLDGIIPTEGGQLFKAGDWLLLQNEMSSAGHALALAKQRGMVTVFNPAPMSDNVLSEYDLNLVDICIVNETEAIHLLRLLNETTADSLATSLSPAELVNKLLARFPTLAGVIVTLGSDGLVAKFHTTATTDNSSMDLIQVAACPIRDKVVDTTGAGDTFIGYLVTGLSEHGWRPDQPLAREVMESVLRRA